MPDNYQLLFHEILDKVAKAKSKNQKVTLLREYNTEALRMIIKSSFDPKIEWQLPSGEVPYIINEAPEGTEHNVLSYEARKLYHFIKGGNPTLSQNKRESMFVQLLEGLQQGEAEVVTAAKDKKLHQKYKGLSANVVKEAFGWDDDYVKEVVAYPATPGPANG